MLEIEIEDEKKPEENNAVDLTIDSKNVISESINQGIFENMPKKDYHAIDGVSSTQFQDMELSIAIFENREHFKHSIPAFDVGNLIHDALAFPNFYKHMYMECQTIGLDTVNANNLRKENPDKMIVGPNMIENSEIIAKKVTLIYGKFINLGSKEVSYIFKDPVTGLIFKFCPDLYLKEHGIILDYKTTKETTHAGFLNTIEKYNYHRSAAFYIDCANKVIELFKLDLPKVTQFGWIAIPKESPNKPFGFMASDELIEKGRVSYTNLLDKYMSVKSGGKDELFKVAHSWEYRKENY